jgi:hypothetical protein
VHEQNTVNSLCFLFDRQRRDKTHCASYASGTALACRGPAAAQQPEDPEDEKQIGLWLDQEVSIGLSPSRSFEVEFNERFDDGVSRDLTHGRPNLA